MQPLVEHGFRAKACGKLWESNKDALAVVRVSMKASISDGTHEAAAILDCC
jgi:hypothetical protein